MIGYFNISVPCPRKPSIHNMFSVRGFHMHEYYENFRMCFTHATFTARAMACPASTGISGSTCKCRSTS